MNQPRNIYSTAPSYGNQQIMKYIQVYGRNMNREYVVVRQKLSIFLNESVPCRSAHGSQRNRTVQTQNGYGCVKSMYVLKQYGM